MGHLRAKACEGSPAKQYGLGLAGANRGYRFFMTVASGRRRFPSREMSAA
jgi:hypothetical protein